ncbi:MAG TPA: response regulator transcription factor [Actinomycetaceae bacterium]|nr:response regulator transcription factor [Actinomycetaceae bacterium]
MRVLLADDHQLMLEGLRSLLLAHGIDVVGVARDGLECLAMARDLHPDIILMDVAMPRCDGLCATRMVKSEMPEIKVIMLSAAADDHTLFEAVKAGATGFLLKSMDAADLISALNDALADVPPLAPGLASRLLAEFARGHGDPATHDDVDPNPVEMRTPPAVDGDAGAGESGAGRDPRLTVRQEEILALLAQGLSYKDVAARVWLTPRTVKYHMSEIMRKLHLSNRAQVLAYAGRRGLGIETRNGSHDGASANG